jgi:hypothetical protein
MRPLRSTLPLLLSFLGLAATSASAADHPASLLLERPGAEGPWFSPWAQDARGGLQDLIGTELAIERASGSVTDAAVLQVGEGWDPRRVGVRQHNTRWFGLSAGLLGEDRASRRAPEACVQLEGELPGEGVRTLHIDRPLPRQSAPQPPEILVGARAADGEAFGAITLRPGDVVTQVLVETPGKLPQERLDLEQGGFKLSVRRKGEVATVCSARLTPSTPVLNGLHPHAEPTVTEDQDQGGADPQVAHSRSDTTITIEDHGVAAVQDGLGVQSLQSGR